MPPFPESPEQKTLKKTLSRLEQGAIPYMLTGSMALNYYAQPRATNDFDIVIEIPRGSSGRLVDLFQNDFYIVRETVEAEIARGGFFNVIDNETIFKVDFIVKKRDPYSLVQFERRQRKEFAGIQAYVISPEDLVLAKILWSHESHSEMQERDVKNLFSLLSKELDYPYMEKWAGSLGLLDRLKGFYASS